MGVDVRIFCEGKENKMSTDIVYVLGNGSHWQDNEIRFSLRSIVKYFDVGTVFIVGEYPKWMREAVHIPYPDETQHKQKNVHAKLRAAIRDERVGDPFVLMNDDFYFLEHVEEILCYSRGTMQEMIDRHPVKSGYYYQSQTATQDALKRAKVKEPIDFGVHAPIVYQKEKLLEAIRFAEKNHAFMLRTVYLNLFGSVPVKVMDFKAKGLNEMALQLHQSREFFSSDDSLVYEAHFRNWLKTKFPKVSRFEKDGGRGVEEKPKGSGMWLKYHAIQNFNFGGKEYYKGDLLDETTGKAVARMRGGEELVEVK